jgi:hypothetical protein
VYEQLRGHGGTDVQEICSVIGKVLEFPGSPPTIEYVCVALPQQEFRQTLKLFGVGPAPMFVTITVTVRSHWQYRPAGPSTILQV